MKKSILALSLTMMVIVVSTSVGATTTDELFGRKQESETTEEQQLIEEETSEELTVPEEEISKPSSTSEEETTTVSNDLSTLINEYVEDHYKSLEGFVKLTKENINVLQKCTYNDVSYKTMLETVYSGCTWTCYFDDPQTVRFTGVDSMGREHTAFWQVSNRISDSSYYGPFDCVDSYEFLMNSYSMYLQIVGDSSYESSSVDDSPSSFASY